jgi:PKD repeat protein
MSDANGNADGVASWIYCHIDTTGGNGYVAPVGGVISNQILWEYGNSNLDNSASVTFGFLNALTNGDARLVCASSASCWLYGWTPQLAPNILTNPVSLTVTAGTVATFSVAATGVPDPSYQWLLNGTNVINATANNSMLVISNALAGDAGVYSVIVSNVAGTVTSSNATLTVTGTAPTASFMASPTSGTEPLAVTFTDTSGGSSNITLYWDFGDNSQATNAGGASFVHTYAAGTYTVTLTASNGFGANSTLESNDLISVVSVFATWQQQYFRSTNCALCAGNASYTGDGMSNTDKFLAGFNPTNAAAYLHILGVVKSSSDIIVTYLGASGDTNYVPGVQSRTNVLDFTTGDARGNYTNGGWQDTGQTNILGVGISAAGGEGTGLGTVTNMTDVGGATSAPTRYYRIRLVP